MFTQQVSVPISELTELEVICPSCSSAYILEKTRWSLPSCPMCNEAFGPRLSEALQTYVRFVESARTLNVGVHFLVKVNELESKQEVRTPQERVLATG